MNRIKEQDSGTISVADITIAQLSRGLYRSTATAFKELVNNAYDADATVVRIDTNYPEFDFISCVDNGSGMPLKEFLRYFRDEGIGSCIKRKGAKDTTAVYNRPVIGRLGIGMLAVGQLCHSFEIESHYKDDDEVDKAFHATIVLLEDTIPDIERVIRDEDLDKKEIDVGLWAYEEIPYDESKKGFRVYSSDVRNTYLNEMKSSVDKKTHEMLSFNLPTLHSEFYDQVGKSIRECKPYLETIWELCILCPLPYYGEIHEFPTKLSLFKEEDITDEAGQALTMIRDRQSRFGNWEFRVVFDGIDLRRYIQFPTKPQANPRLFYISFDDVVADEPLRFSGYIFGQTQAVTPLELNGVQIRLRAVGIGGYDSTFLKYYRQIETIRSRWVSGEIFVDDGLERALNIDRDSFNEHDEHFKRLQEKLHEKLDTVFNKLDSIARAQQEEKRNVKDELLKGSMQGIVAKQSQGKFKLLQYDLGSSGPVVSVDEGKGEIVLNTASRPLRKKKADTILRHAILAYHISRKIAKTEEEQYDIFYRLIKDILRELT